MAELTLEQKKVLALAKARVRQQMNTWEKIDGLSASANNFFGIGPHISATAAAGRDPQSREYFDYDSSFGNRYQGYLEANRASQERFSKEYPITAAADILTSTAATGGAAMIPTGARTLGLTGSLLSRTANSAASTAALSGTETVLDKAGSDNPASVGDVVRSMTIGGTIGGVLPGVGDAASKIGSGISKAVRGRRDLVRGKSVGQKATEKISPAMEDAGISIDDAIAGLHNGRVLAQQDPVLGDLTRSVHRSGGAARTHINDALKEGFEQNQQSARNAISDGLGGEENYYRWLDTFKKEKVKKAAPLYDQAFKKTGGPTGRPRNWMKL